MTGIPGDSAGHPATEEGEGAAPDRSPVSRPTCFPYLLSAKADTDFSLLMEGWAFINTSSGW